MVINNQQSLVLLNQSSVEKGLESCVTKSGECPSGPTYCLLTFFKCLKWCMMIPYKLEYCSKAGSYQISMNRTTMILFWIFPIIGTIYHAAVVVMDSKYDSSIRSVIIYIITFSLTCWTDVVLLFLFCKRNSFLRVMTRLDDICVQLERRGTSLTKRNKGKVLVSMLSTGCVLMAIVEVAFFFLKLHQDVRYTRILEVTINQTEHFQTYFPRLKGSNPGKFFLAVLGCLHLAINNIYYFSIGHFGYALLLMFCVIIGNLYVSLNSSIPVKFSSEAEMNEAIDIYNTIRSFTADVNNTIGTIMAWGILAHLPYNAFKINDLLTGGILIQLSYLVHIVMYLGILITGSNVHYQVTFFMDRLACDKLTLENTALQSKLGLMLQQSRRGGLRGGGLFLLTYGFLGHIIGVILTYAILTVQFQHP